MSFRVAKRARRPLSARALALLVSAASVLGACDVITSVGPKSCDRTDKANPLVAYSDGNAQGGIYMSSPWDKELLFFPGGMRVRLEHKLGSVPRAWQAYIAFDESGVKGGPLATAAGNQVELLGIDEQAITVKNGGCADYWLLVTAEVESAAPPAAPASSSDP